MLTPRRASPFTDANQPTRPTAPPTTPDEPPPTRQPQPTHHHDKPPGHTNTPAASHTTTATPQATQAAPTTNAETASRTPADYRHDQSQTGYPTYHHAHARHTRRTPTGGSEQQADEPTLPPKRTVDENAPTTARRNNPQSTQTHTPTTPTDV